MTVLDLIATVLLSLNPGTGGVPVLAPLSKPKPPKQQEKREWRRRDPTNPTALIVSLVIIFVIGIAVLAINPNWLARLRGKEPSTSPEDGRVSGSGNDGVRPDMSQTAAGTPRSQPQYEHPDPALPELPPPAYVAQEHQLDLDQHIAQPLPQPQSQSQCQPQSQDWYRKHQEEYARQQDEYARLQDAQQRSLHQDVEEMGRQQANLIQSLGVGGRKS